MSRAPRRLADQGPYRDAFRAEAQAAEPGDLSALRSRTLARAAEAPAGSAASPWAIGGAVAALAIGGFVGLQVAERASSGPDRRSVATPERAAAEPRAPSDGRATGPDLARRSAPVDEAVYADGPRSPLRLAPLASFDDPALAPAEDRGDEAPRRARLAARPLGARPPAQEAGTARAKPGGEPRGSSPPRAGRSAGLSRAPNRAEAAPEGIPRRARAAPMPSPDAPPPAARGDASEAATASGTGATPDADGLPRRRRAGDLAGELAAYDRAQAAMARRAWDEAAEAYRRYLEAWTRGRLRPEAQLDRLEALVRGGRVGRAAELATRLLDDAGVEAHHVELRRLAVDLRVREGACEAARALAEGDSELLDAAQRCEEGGR